MIYCRHSKNTPNPFIPFLSIKILSISNCANNKHRWNSMSLKSVSLEMQLRVVDHSLSNLKIELQTILFSKMNLKINASQQANRNRSKDIPHSCTPNRNFQFYTKYENLLLVFGSSMETWKRTGKTFPFIFILKLHNCVVVVSGIKNVLFTTTEKHRKEQK